MINRMRNRMRNPILNRAGIRPSRNDPKAQDNKRPGEGPPDLDQMWRDFNVRLNRLFGGKNNGDSGGPGCFSPDC